MTIVKIGSYHILLVRDTRKYLLGVHVHAYVVDMYVQYAYKGNNL